MADAILRSCLTDSVTPKTAYSYKRDLAYFWAWVEVVHGIKTETYPVALDWLIQFVEEHINGLSFERHHQLRLLGQEPQGKPLSIATMRRYFSPLSIEHTLREVSNTCRHPTFTFLMRRLGRRQGAKKRTHLPITSDILNRLLAECGHDLRGQRNRALLLVGFAGGGRRSSELTSLSVEHLEPVTKGYLARLPVHKTSGATQEPLVFPILDNAAVQLDRWLGAARITEGRVFRGILNNAILDSLSLQSVARVVKTLADAAGLPISRYTAHSLRSGFMTQAAKEDISLLEAMFISGHRTVNSAMLYYKGGTIESNRAAHLSQEIDPGITRREEAPPVQMEWFREEMG
jgi:integrase